MPDLTQGYPGNTTIVEAIYSTGPINPNLSGPEIADALFTNFINYAISVHWQYDGSTCNCTDLSNAFLAAWVYIKTAKRTAALPSPGDAKSTEVFDGYASVTSNAIHVFNGPANGNIIKRSTGLTDGRCLFPNHQAVRVGDKYYDPTFNLATNVSAYDATVIQYRLMRPNSAQWLYRTGDGRFLYAHNLVRVPQFSDSWIEMNGTLWTPLNEWVVQTSRDGHTRSERLKAVDVAIGNFEKQGMPAFQALKRAVQDWKVKDPSEFQARDRATGCVTKLKTLLGA